MARSLAVVAASGIAISVVCLSLASFFSPNRGYSLPFSSGRACDSGSWRSRHPVGQTPVIGSDDIVTREYNWSGSARADICIPGTVYYEPGPAWRVTVKGPESSLDRLRIEDGRIYVDGSLMYSNSSSLEVRITGPSLESFGLRGSGALILENIAQKELEIDLFGSGSVRGQGTVGKLELRLFGSGNVNLAELATGDVDASLFGSGNVDVAPTGDVEVKTFGSGDVRLHARPRSLSTRTFGSGRTVQLDSDQGRPEESSPPAPTEAVDRAKRI